MKLKKIVNILIVIIVIAALLLSLNRVFYGTWNIFNYPTRLVFQGLYYANFGYKTLSDADKPKYEVSRIIDRITGKRIYSKNKDFIGPGKIVYLYIGNNAYIVFGSGGGG